MSTYYVKNGGSDAASGLSDALAWETIAKVNGSSFNAGDSILFKRDSTWREQLTVPSSGSSGLPITFGAYGTGADPIISGSDLKTNWTSEEFGDGYLDNTTGYTHTDADPGTTYNFSGVDWVVEIDCALPDYTPASNRYLVAKDNETNERVWALRLQTNGQLFVELFAADSEYIGQYNATNVVTSADGARAKFKVKFDFDNGSGKSDVTFYENDVSLSGPVNFTQPILHADSTAKLSAMASTYPNVKTPGKLYSVKIWSDLAQTTLIKELNFTNTAQLTSTPPDYSAWNDGTHAWTNVADYTYNPPSGTVYYATSTEPKQTFYDSSRVVLAATKGGLVTGKWWWDSANTRTYIFDNPSGHTVEVSQRDYAIQSTDESYLAFNNLQVEHANASGFYNDGANNHVVISGLVSQYNTKNGISLLYTTSSSVTSSTTAYNGTHGIWFYRSPGILIDGNTIHDNCQLDTENYSAGIKCNDPAGQSVDFIIQKNLVYSNGIGQASERGGGIWIDSTLNAGTIQYNRVYSNNISGILIDTSSGVKILYNVIYNNGVEGSQEGCGIIVFGDWYTQIANTLIYGNALYGNYQFGIALWGPTTPGEDGFINNTVKNNIVVGTVTGPNFYADLGAENPGTNGSGNVYEYNCFGAEKADFIRWGAATPDTYDAWETLYGGTTHSIEADPLFTNAAGGDFTLQAGSPCIDAGVDLGTDYQMALAPGSTWP